MPGTALLLTPLMTHDTTPIQQAPTLQAIPKVLPAQGSVFAAPYKSALIGTLTLVADENYLYACHFPCDRFPDFGNPAVPIEADADASPVLRAVAEWLDAYFAGRQPSPDALPLNPQGSAYQRRVWEILAHIPYAKTRTYGEIAAEIAFGTGKRPCAQAVGGAVGHNPIGIIIPCHRVIGAGGALVGFGGGLDTKIALLAHEGVH